MRELAVFGGRTQASKRREAPEGVIADVAARPVAPTEEHWSERRAAVGIPLPVGPPPMKIEALPLAFITQISPLRVLYAILPCRLETVAGGIAAGVAGWLAWAAYAEASAGVAAAAVPMCRVIPLARVLAGGGGGSCRACVCGGVARWRPRPPRGARSVARRSRWRRRVPRAREPHRW
jgi:hypothetical protein